VSPRSARDLAKYGAKYGALALLAGLAAFKAYDFSRFAYVRYADPVSAQEERPTDAAALSGWLDTRIGNDQQFLPGQKDAALARQSLVERPLSRASLRIMALAADARGEIAFADTAMRLSERVSRRDSLAQLWLIERAVQKDDLKSAVAHYHAALSVQPGLGKILLPVLANALAFPEVREEIRPYLEQRASWAPSLIQAAVDQAPTADLIDLMMPVAGILSDDQYTAANTRLIARLASEGKADLAWDYAQKLWPDFDRERFAKFSWNENNTDDQLGSLAWTLAHDSKITADLNAGSSLAISLSPLALGLIARRDVMVEPGASYQLTQRLAFDAGTPKGQIRWNGECVAADGTIVPAWEQNIPSASSATSTYRFAVRVPAGCRLMRISLSGTGPDSQLASTLKISDIAFAQDK
jgi:hypothetical protein